MEEMEEQVNKQHSMHRINGKVTNVWYIQKKTDKIFCSSLQEYNNVQYFVYKMFIIVNI